LNFQGFKELLSVIEPHTFHVLHPLVLVFQRSKLNDLTYSMNSLSQLLYRLAKMCSTCSPIML